MLILLLALIQFVILLGVDPKNYSEELGKQYAMEEVVNSLWAHLGFVLQWAKYGINVKPKENE